MYSQPLKVTPQLEQRINARWLLWHPWMIMACRRIPNIPVEVSLSSARDLHHQRYVQALAQGIREAVLRRRNLDDPRHSDEQFRATVENILRYRKAQMGNQNGIYSRKSPKEQHVTSSD
jgi:hypothetical protein